MRATHLASLACLAWLAACAAPAATAIDLDVGYEESWSLTALAVRGADNASSIAPRHDVRILVPDAWVATSIKIELHGMRGDAVRARGTVTVTPIAGRTVTATVALTLVRCGAWCVAGATTCTGDGVSVCEQRDDMCFEWSEPVACSGATPYCSLGTCLAKCIDECSDGEIRCAGPDGVQRCGQADRDPCRDWRPVEPCAAGTTCSAGHCAAGCDDECTAGEARCVNGGVATCGEFDGDDCTESSPVAPCPGGNCSAGACRSTCTDDCTATSCAGLTYHACGQFDLDACNDLSPGISCVPAEDCMDGACSPTAGCSSAPTVCETPPAATCVDADTLRTFQPAGTCSVDACSYPFIDTHCDDGCSAGRCNCPSTTCTSELLASGQGQARDLRLDDTHLYWAVTDTANQGFLVRWAKAGGAPEVLTAAGEDVGRIAIDDTHVYWSDYTADRVLRRHKATGAIQPFVGGTLLGALAVDNTHVYWTGRGVAFMFFVERRAKTGGAGETLAQDFDAVGYIDVNATHVFWSTLGAQLRIWRRARSGGSAEVIAMQDLSGGAVVHADADHVYWLAGRTLWRLPTNLGGPVENFANDAAVTDFWLDATHVYWARPGRIVRKPKAGGPIDELSLEEPVLVARDATHIYYVTGTGFTQEVRRVPACACGF